MKKQFLTFVLFINIICAYAQQNAINEEELKEDLNEILTTLSQYYAYFDEKNIDINCIRAYYEAQIKNVKTEEDTVLFFEYLLDEFYDNHLTLETNRNNSYRLFAPIYTSIKNDKPIIVNIWQSQIENLDQDTVGAEIIAFNGIAFDKAIADFPTHCQNKNNAEVKEWIANKILAGRYSEPRVLTLKLANGKSAQLDLDSLALKNNKTLLSSSIKDNIGIIRINNSLGNDALINAFDKALSELSNTKGLIIDLRNTIFGGDSYEARGIMSRFISEPKPYQKHAYMAKSQNNPDIERSWVEYVSPRLDTYTKPVVVLVGRWTGSMGEGLAIGFEGMGRAKIVGTEMRRLAGEVTDVGFKHQKYNYKLTTAKLYHVNGTLREDYVPTYYVKQTTCENDEILEKGIEIIMKLERE